MLAFFMALLMPLLVFSQKEVPGAVKAAFIKKYPEAKKVKWEKRGHNYEAEYRIKKKEIEVVFTPDGNWMYTATELDRRKLPAQIVNGLRTQGFSDWKLDEAGIADTPLYNQVYIVEAEKDKLSYDLFFDKEGKLLQKHLVKEGK